MKQRIEYTPQGVCSRRITVEIEDGVITECSFLGGCSGNTQGVAALVKGMKAEDAIARLSGIRCGFKQTSCPDQFTKALAKALKENTNTENGSNI